METHFEFFQLDSTSCFAARRISFCLGGGVSGGLGGWVVVWGGGGLRREGRECGNVGMVMVVVVVVGKEEKGCSTYLAVLEMHHHDLETLAVGQISKCD